MPTRGPPLFLERGTYRLRRVMDAVRLLPLLGLVLWMIPLLWPSAGDPSGATVPMSRALLYIFAVWAVLIVASGALWLRIRKLPQKDEPSVDERPD